MGSKLGRKLQFGVKHVLIQRTGEITIPFSFSKVITINYNLSFVFRTYCIRQSQRIEEMMVTHALWNLWTHFIDLKVLQNSIRPGNLRKLADEQFAKNSSVSRLTRNSSLISALNFIIFSVKFGLLKFFANEHYLTLKNQNLHVDMT